MKNFRKATLVGGAIATLGFMGAIAAPANAGQLHNGWNYSIDNFNDGSGGATYNYKGLASIDTGDQIIFALSAGLNYNENSSSNLTHGDLFLNFSGGDFDTANGTESLLAVKFAPNDTTFEAGLYKNVTGGDLNKFATINHTGQNYGSLKQYDNYGYLKDTNAYGTDLSTKQEVYDYFYSDAVANSPTTSNTPFMNAIQSGTKVGDVSMLNKTSLDGLGLDFGHFNAVGSDVFGIAINKSMLEGILPGGINDFMAHVILECGNDGVALASNFSLPEDNDETVPEPSALLGLSAIGLAFLRKRRQSSVS